MRGSPCVAHATAHGSFLQDEESTALIVACSNGRIDVARCLIAAGADVNASTVRWLRWSCSPDCSFAEISHELRVTAVGPPVVTCYLSQMFSNTAVSVARDAHHADIVDMLLEAGAMG